MASSAKTVDLSAKCKDCGAIGFYHCEDGPKCICRKAHHPFNPVEEKPLTNNEVRHNINVRIKGILIDLSTLETVHGQKRNENQIAALKKVLKDYEERISTIPANDATYVGGR